MRYKLSPEQRAAIILRYGQAGYDDPTEALQAYQRRRYRNEELGIDNVRSASASQLAAARRAHALGAQVPGPLGVTSAPGPQPAAPPRNPDAAGMMSRSAMVAGQIAAPPGSSQQMAQMPPPPMAAGAVSTALRRRNRGPVYIRG